MNAIEIFIVTRSVVLQQGLCALLESLPEVTHVKVLTDLPAAYAEIEEIQPRIVVLSEDLFGGDPKATLEKIRCLSPDTQRVLLVDEVQKMNLLLSHAEVIFIKGIAPSVIASTLAKLLGIG